MGGGVKVFSWHGVGASSSGRCGYEGKDARGCFQAVV
jgi:hypothetical protein